MTTNKELHLINLSSIAVDIAEELSKDVGPPWVAEGTFIYFQLENESIGLTITTSWVGSDRLVINGLIPGGKLSKKSIGVHGYRKIVDIVKEIKERLLPEYFEEYEVAKAEYRERLAKAFDRDFNVEMIKRSFLNQPKEYPYEQDDSTREITYHIGEHIQASQIGRAHV